MVPFECCDVWCVVLRRWEMRCHHMRLDFDRRFKCHYFMAALTHCSRRQKSSQHCFDCVEQEKGVNVGCVERYLMLVARCSYQCHTLCSLYATCMKWFLYAVIFGCHVRYARYTTVVGDDGREKMENYPKVKMRKIDWHNFISANDDEHIIKWNGKQTVSCSAANEHMGDAKCE